VGRSIVGRTYNGSYYEEDGGIRVRYDESK
jgi:hypothetical protein